jgi:hypothetical protein
VRVHDTSISGRGSPPRYPLGLLPAAQLTPRAAGERSDFVPWPRAADLALPRVGSYLGYSGRAANVAAKAAHDPSLTIARVAEGTPPSGAEP